MYGIKKHTVYIKHKVYKTKWSLLCQLKWLSVSHDTLVPEENCLSQSKRLWQGGRSAHVARAEMCGEEARLRYICTRGQGSYVSGVGHPQRRSWENSTLGMRGAKTFIEKTQKGGVHHFQGITETGFILLLRLAEPHTPESCSPPCQSPLVMAAGGSALLDQELCLSCCPRGSGDPSLQDAVYSLAHYADSQTCLLRLWDSGLLPPINCCVCVLYSF